ncbi:hypothetical protein ACJX0J_014895, partial [Zea mays]
HRCIYKYLYQKHEDTHTTILKAVAHALMKLRRQLKHHTTFGHYISTDSCFTSASLITAKPEEKIAIKVLFQIFMLNYTQFYASFNLLMNLCYMTSRYSEIHYNEMIKVTWNFGYSEGKTISRIWMSGYSDIRYSEIVIDYGKTISRIWMSGYSDIVIDYVNEFLNIESVNAFLLHEMMSRYSEIDNSEIGYGEMTSGYSDMMSRYSEIVIDYVNEFLDMMSGYSEMVTLNLSMFFCYIGYSAIISRIWMSNYSEIEIDLASFLLVFGFSGFWLNTSMMDIYLLLIGLIHILKQMYIIYI